MPLKLVQPFKKKSPHWYVRGSYLGQRVFRSTGTGKRAVALQVLKKFEREIESGEFSRKGEPTFASAAAEYMKAGGERIYVTRLLYHFGDAPLSNIDQAAVDQAAIELYPKGSSATRNRSVYTPVSAILRHVGYGWGMRRPKGASGNRTTAWLWPEQAFALIAEAEKLSGDFAALLTVLLYTGMRLSEALGLKWNDVRLADAFAYIPDTKNDDPRAVFLPPPAVAALANLPNRSSGRAFAFSKGGHLYSLLRAAAARADVELPERSAFHIFRHTYATWMRRYAGLDTKGLVATGTWKDRKSADRYEHVQVTEEARKAVLLPVPGRKVG